MVFDFVIFEEDFLETLKIINLKKTVGTPFIFTFPAFFVF